MLRFGLHSIRRRVGRFRFVVVADADAAASCWCSHHNRRSPSLANGRHQPPSQQRQQQSTNLDECFTRHRRRFR